jgi:hypothetical protein
MPFAPETCLMFGTTEPFCAIRASRERVFLHTSTGIAQGLNHVRRGPFGKGLYLVQFRSALRLSCLLDGAAKYELYLHTR